MQMSQHAQHLLFLWCKESNPPTPKQSVPLKKKIVNSDVNKCVQNGYFFHFANVTRQNTRSMICKHTLCDHHGNQELQ